MGQQVIVCPGGAYNIFSSIVDDWFFTKPVTKKQIVDMLRKEAADEAEAQAEKIFRDLKMGRKPYHQFTLTYEQAEKLRKEVHGGGEK